MEEKGLDINFFIGIFLIFGLLMWFNINQMPAEITPQSINEESNLNTESPRTQKSKTVNKNDQTIVKSNNEIKEELEKAAEEEIDHLVWCDKRIQELGGKTSKLNPIFYSGSFLLGAFTSIVDERYNLGFLAETEKQVANHLSNHLKQIDKSDKKTIKIIEAMRDDEEEHANSALKMGAKNLPRPMKKIMGYASKVMTKTTFYI